MYMNIYKNTWNLLYSPNIRKISPYRTLCRSTMVTIANSGICRKSYIVLQFIVDILHTRKGQYAY